MEKGLVLLVLALVACGSVVAQDEWDEVMASSVMPTVSPTTTPSPPKELKPQTFTLTDGNSSKPCLRMSVALAVTFKYNSSSANHTMRTKEYPVTPSATIVKGASHCNASATTALLRLMVDTDQVESNLFINFEFNGSNKSGDTHWSMKPITITMEKDFLEADIPATDTQFNTTDKLYEDNANGNIEYERSYICSSVQTVTFDKADSIEPKLNVSQLQAQAFSFSNKNKDGFDPARTCQLDSTGANKIVPIAVGAALAGLVVVVLIAYLIGRLRSRRQSSYEALS